MIHSGITRSNPDYLGEIRLLSQKYFKMLWCMITLENLATDWKKRDWTIVFDALFVVFLNIGTIFSLLQSCGSIPQFKQFLNILKRGSIIVSPGIFKIRILIISCPWDLSGSSLQVILLISSFVNSMFASY